jgi:hypothetical protein
MINRSSYRACCLCAIRHCGEYAANKDPRIQESVQVRRFDGADTWTFID